MPEIVVLSETPTLEDIERLEQQMLLAEPTRGVELVTRDYFGPGLYAREIFIPARAALIGCRHKVDHLVTFEGDITVWHEGNMVRLTGRHTLTSTAGAKRVGYAHQDTYCTGYFATEETDVRKLEQMLVEDSEMLQRNRKPVLPHRAPQPPQMIEA